MELQNKGKAEPTSDQPLIVPVKAEKPVKIVCDVCGYANPEHTALCKMCSNYLEGDE